MPESRLENDRISNFSSSVWTSEVLVESKYERRAARAMMTTKSGLSVTDRYIRLFICRNVSVLILIVTA